MKFCISHFPLQVIPNFRHYNINVFVTSICVSGFILELDCMIFRGHNSDSVICQ